MRCPLFLFPRNYRYLLTLYIFYVIVKYIQKFSSLNYKNREDKNTSGNAKEISALISIAFQTDTLGWSVDEWKLVEGNHPTLQNVGMK